MQRSTSIAVCSAGGLDGRHHDGGAVMQRSMSIAMCGDGGFEERHHDGGAVMKLAMTWWRRRYLPTDSGGL
jgi:hypothetical protein